MTPVEVSELEQRLDETLPLVAKRAAKANDDRRPSSDVITAMADRGLLRLIVPRGYGGLEVHPRTFLELVERLARVDGSTAWTVMTLNEEAGIASAYLDPGSVAELFTGEPTTSVAGSGVPRGRAEQVEGGWLVTGRWDFVSGCTAADRVVLASLVVGAAPAQLCFVLVPTDEVTIDDTWRTAGLRGTGSNDVVLDRHFVPDRWAGVIESFGRPRPDTPFYRLPSGLRFPFPKVGVAAGIARAALGEFTALAEGKRPLFNKGSLRERPSAQVAFAEAEARHSAGLAWVHEMLDELWLVAEAGRPIPEALHARCRLACSHAVGASIDAIELLCREAGSTANFASSPLPTLLADARAVAGHFMVAPFQVTTAGRILLGLESGDPHF
ncbi:MAG: acyl-CoA dehydrogenase family protein [Acidimicrobiia bacterium]|nr:acyl-CoA dehydrogenase family protein [Acidimicrobiia bacterium]